MADTQQSLRMQRRIAGQRQSGKLQAASRDEKNLGHTYEASLYHNEAQKLIKLTNPISKKEKKRSAAAGY